MFGTLECLCLDLLRGIEDSWHNHSVKRFTLEIFRRRPDRLSFFRIRHLAVGKFGDRCPGFLRLIGTCSVLFVFCEKSGTRGIIYFFGRRWPGRLRFSGFRSSHFVCPGLLRWIGTRSGSQLTVGMFDSRCLGILRRIETRSGSAANCEYVPI